MCGITGWIDTQNNLSNRSKIIKDMTNKLINRGPDDFGYYISQNVLLGHRRLIVVDPTGGSQPMTAQIGDRSYTIVYNGELYNTEEIRKKLLDMGYKFNSYSDTEVLLKSYIQWGPDCLKYLNGIFAFGVWDESNRSLFLARDQLGVKPLFYSYINNSLIFASEIKAILAHPMIQPIIDKTGLMEIFGLGPARGLGSGIFKDIKEIPPAHYLIYNSNGLYLKEYWKLEAKPHTENLESTIEHTRSLLENAIERQLVSDVPLCTFLSGGLDSSAISAIISKILKQKGKGILNTFSIDYKDNGKYFTVNEFQPSSDSYWVKKMVKFIGSKHHYIELENKQLVLALREAVKARDIPGMADIDSSLYLFCKEVRKDFVVAISGECADEIFGGYPWYTREEDIQANTFPWSKSINQRKAILSNEFKSLPLEEYVTQKYQDTIKKVPYIKGEPQKERRMRELFYLNIKWFMITLLNRKDRMSMSNSLEVRVPFADRRIVEYGFNIPTEIKFCDGREKGLLRKALTDILPKDIIDRKKSPYPKTYNPEYLKNVQEIMKEILRDKKSPIHQIIDADEVKELVSSGGKSLKKPWFGQLMTGPQLIAYLIQIEFWLREFSVIIK